MNRANKRPDQKMTEADALEFLKKRRLGVLSTTGYGKAPYGVPLYYTWTEDGPSFQFTEGQLWDHLRYDSRVCFTVTEEDNGKTGSSALVFGNAEIIQTPCSSQPGFMRIQVISVSGMTGADPANAIKRTPEFLPLRSTESSPGTPEQNTDPAHSRAW